MKTTKVKPQLLDPRMAKQVMKPLSPEEQNRIAENGAKATLAYIKWSCENGRILRNILGQ